MERKERRVTPSESVSLVSILQSVDIFKSLWDRIQFLSFFVILSACRLRFQYSVACRNFTLTGSLNSQENV